MEIGMEWNGKETEGMERDKKMEGTYHDVGPRKYISFGGQIPTCYAMSHELTIPILSVPFVLNNKHGS